MRKPSKTSKPTFPQTCMTPNFHDAVCDYPPYSYGQIVVTWSIENSKRGRKHESWCCWARCIRPEAFGGYGQHSGYRGYHPDGREPGRHRRGREEVQGPSLDRRSRGES